MLLSIQSH